MQWIQHKRPRFLPGLRNLKSFCNAVSLSCLLLAAGSLPCFSQDEVDSGETLAPLVLNAEGAQAVTNLARAIAGANATTATVDDNVAAILAILQTVSLNMSNINGGFRVVPMLSTSSNRTLAQFLGAGLYLQQPANNTIPAINQSTLRFILDSLLGSRGATTPDASAIHGGLIPMLYDYTEWMKQQTFGGSNVWTRADIDAIFARTNYWSESAVASTLQNLSDIGASLGYISGDVYSLIGYQGNIWNQLYDWDQTIKTQADDGYAWRVLWDSSWKDDEQQMFNTLSRQITAALSNLTQVVSDSVGQGSYMDQLISDLSQDVYNLWGDYADNASYQTSLMDDLNQLVGSISTIIEGFSAEMDSDNSELLLSLDGVIQAIESFHSGFDNFVVSKLGYPEEVTQYQLLENGFRHLFRNELGFDLYSSLTLFDTQTNIVQLLDSVATVSQDDIVQAASLTNKANQASAQGASDYDRLDSSAQDEIEDCIEDNEPDWNEHKYTGTDPTSVLDSTFSSLGTKLSDQLPVINPTTDKQLVLFRGNMPIIQNQQTRAQPGVRLDVSYSLKDNDDVSIGMVRIKTLMEFIWNVCSALLMMAMFRRFWLWMSNQEV